MLRCVDSATLIHRSRVASGLTQRELAERASTSVSAVCLYETGQRVPRVDTLARILAATGNTLVLDTFCPEPRDDARSNRILVQVLELAEQLPFEAAHEIQAPVFAELAR